MKFDWHIHAPQRMNHAKFGDLMTCSLIAPPLGQNVQTPFFHYLHSAIIHQASPCFNVDIMDIAIIPAVFCECLIICYSVPQMQL